MLSGKKISVEKLINDVYRDTDYEGHVNKADMVEWAADAMDLIGIPMSLETKIATENSYNSALKPYVTLSDYKCFIPCDFISMVQIRDYDTKETLRYSSNSFHTNSSHTETNKMELEGDKTYKIKGSCLYTNYKEGKLEIMYMGYPCDENGYPLIPEETRYSMAVKAYLQYKLDYKMWRHNKLAEAVFRDSESEWLFRVKSAATFGHTPSVDQMESIKNQMLRLITHPNEHAAGFRGMSIQEQKFN